MKHVCDYSDAVLPVQQCYVHVFRWATNSVNWATSMDN